MTTRCEFIIIAGLGLVTERAIVINDCIADLDSAIKLLEEFRAFLVESRSQHPRDVSAIEFLDKAEIAEYETRLVMASFAAIRRDVDSDEESELAEVISDNFTSGLWIERGMRDMPWPGFWELEIEEIRGYNPAEADRLQGILYTLS